MLAILCTVLSDHQNNLGPGIGTSSNSELSEFAYELVSAISKIDSNILLKVLPLLEEQLGADDVDTRLQVVEVLAQIFEDQGYSLMEQHRKLWNKFVSRSIDQDASVRIQCAKHLATLGKAIAEVHADVWAKIRPMLLDEDPTVRAQACQTAFELAIVQPGMTAEVLAHRPILYLSANGPTCTALHCA